MRGAKWLKWGAGELEEFGPTCIFIIKNAHFNAIINSIEKAMRYSRESQFSCPPLDIITSQKPHCRLFTMNSGVLNDFMFIVDGPLSTTLSE